ncbi:fasciclin domain-containing protein [Saccharicrinis sp. FJH54]|uniref:fasciclin domain-containing protein n=1 Tax=Saccharicrinis sp. FJH54 TaxID=3344665 RepID=UPI0035D4045E
MLLRRKLNILSWFGIIMVLVLSSCKDRMAEHYEDPPWLVGSATDYLKDQGNYTIFLDALEKTDFSTVVSGRGLVTVMAPDDEAFTAYLNSKGYGSIDDMPQAELNKLIGYHLVDYKYNKELFANFQPGGRESYNPAEKGLFYKQRTKATNPITREHGFEPNGTPREYSVFHRNLYLPVFSSYMFDSREIEAKYNYEFLYPNSTWTGDNGGFNIAGATVDQYEIATDNGFLYLIDRVLDPLETVYESLKSEGNYSNFLTLYDQFSYYEYDADISDNYGNGDSLFIHMHTELPAIASEWPVQDANAWSVLTRFANSVFVPDNNALDAFFQETWEPYYDSFADVNPLAVLYLLYNHTFSGDLAFPENIKKDEITTFYGTPVAFDPDADVSKSQICANGVYYGLNTVLTPPMFTSITGPAFRDPKYRMFLHMIAYSDVALPLTSTAINYTIFFPSDEKIVNAGIDGLDIRYYDPTPGKFGDEAVQVNDQTWGNMSSSYMAYYVDSHVATDVLTNVDGIDVYKSRNSYSYLFVKGDSIASNKMYNEGSKFASIQPIEGDWSNGSCYNVDSVLLTETGEFKYLIGLADEIPYLSAYKEFANQLTLAGLLPINAPLPDLRDKYMLFVPSDEAILNAPAGTIPTDPDSLANFLMYYFIPVPYNEISDYAFPGAGIQGDFVTYQGLIKTSPTDTVPASKVTLSDLGSSLRLTTPGGQTANVTSNIPKVYGDCAVYTIDALIQP